MSRLRGAVEGYLSVRRALGFTLVGTERLLSQFAGFAETVGVDTVTTEVALRWATLPPGRSMAWYAQRLAVVRCFARWLQAIDPATVIPPTDLAALPTLPADHAVPVLRQRRCGPAHRGRGTALAVDGGDDANVHRAAVRHRPAHVAKRSASTDDHSISTPPTC